MTHGPSSYEGLLASRSLKEQTDTGIEILSVRGGTLAGYDPRLNYDLGIRIIGNPVTPSAEARGCYLTYDRGHASTTLTVGLVGAFIGTGVSSGTASLHATQAAAVAAARAAAEHITVGSAASAIANLNSLSVGDNAAVFAPVVPATMQVLNAGSLVQPVLVSVASNAQTLHDLIGGLANVRPQTDWFEEAKSELTEVLIDAEGNDVRARLQNFSMMVLAASAMLPVDAPTIDLDHDQNIELFWRTGDQGLLAVIRQDESIHFFGHSMGESWRSDYRLSGNTWRIHFAVYLSPFSKNAQLSYGY
jgi:hypothetical protein